VWDVAGNGKTVLKGSVGRYNNTPGDDFAAAYNLNLATITSYRWSGPCATQSQTNGLWDANGYNCDYIPGTVNLDPNGPAFLALNGGNNGGPAKIPNTAVNPDLAEQFTREYQLLVEKELMPNLAVRGGVSYARNLDTWQQVPNLIPYGAWNVARTVYDPGPNVTPSLNGTAGMPILIYDLNPAYRGAQFSQTIYMNRPDAYADSFTTYEMTLTKRATGRWSAIASYSVTQNHQFVNGVPTNPNLEFFNLDTSAPGKHNALATYVVQPFVLDAAKISLPKYLATSGATICCCSRSASSHTSTTRAKAEGSAAKVTECASPTLVTRGIGIMSAGVCASTTSPRNNAAGVAPEAAACSARARHFSSAGGHAAATSVRDDAS